MERRERNRGERAVGQKHWEEMLGFIRMSDIVDNSVLYGPVNVPTMFHTFVGAYPQLPGVASESGYAAVSQRQYTAAEIIEKVLQLEIPERVAQKNTPVNPALARDMDFTFALTGLPNTVLGIGNTIDSGKEVVVIYHTHGRNAQQALDMLKERAKSRRNKLN